MSEQNGSSTMKEDGGATISAVDKGKGKAIEPETHDVNMELDSSSEEEIDENDVLADEPDEDNMEEIDTDNIIPDGRRTRGRQIDFAKAAELHPEEDDDDDEDDDDFEVAEDEDKMDE